MENGVSTTENRICLSLGFFDCMHLGHRGIVRAAEEFCKKFDAVSAVFTFTDDLGEKIKNAKQLYTFDERKRLFSECGIKEVIAYPFNDTVKNTDKRAFLDGLLNQRNIAAFVCGEDYTFGRGGEGDAEYLRQFCNEKKISLIVVPRIDSGGEKISSTRIKNLLSDSKIEEANVLLGKPFFICNDVVRGRGQGHLFGIPTANVSISKDKLLPASGVYACKAEIDGSTYLAVTNVGDKPTFGDYSQSVEALIDGFKGNLYGKKITVSFLKYLRRIQKFSSPYELADAIRKDLNRSKELC